MQGGVWTGLPRGISNSAAISASAITAVISCAAETEPSAYSRRMIEYIEPVRSRSSSPGNRAAGKNDRSNTTGIASASRTRRISKTSSVALMRSAVRVSASGPCLVADTSLDDADIDDWSSRAEPGNTRNVDIGAMVRDHGTAPAAERAGEPPRALEPLKGLTEGHPTHGERLGELALRGQFLAGGQFARGDQATDPLADLQVHGGRGGPASLQGEGRIGRLGWGRHGPRRAHGGHIPGLRVSGRMRQGVWFLRPDFPHPNSPG